MVINCLAIRFVDVLQFFEESGACFGGFDTLKVLFRLLDDILEALGPLGERNFAMVVAVGCQ